MPSAGDKTQGKEFLKYVGRNVKRCRRHMKWSRAELAKRAGRSVHVIYAIEKGNGKSYKIADLSLVATALHVDFKELLQVKPPDLPRVGWCEDIGMISELAD